MRAIQSMKDEIVAVYRDHIRNSDEAGQDKRSLKKVLAALSLQLGRLVPGWKELNKSQFKRSNPVYNKVYKIIWNSEQSRRQKKLQA